MPLTVKYLNERRGIFSKALGRLTGGELITAMAEVNSPALAQTPVLYTFFDFNAVTGVGITTNQLAAIADLSVKGSRYQSAPRFVVIQAETDLTFALARMWRVFVEESGWETMVFRKRSDAVAWLHERVTARFGIQIPDLDNLDLLA